MRFSFSLAALLFLQHSLAARFGPTYQTQNLQSARITEIWSTLILPDVPSEIIGDIALWLGIEAEHGDLIQSIIENAPPNQGMCNDLGRRWCVLAYTLEDAFNTQHPIVGPSVPMDPGRAVDVRYRYNSDTDMWDQWVIVDGNVISSLSSSRGQHPYNFLFAVECSNDYCSTSPAHSWINTVIILDSPEPSFPDGLYVNNLSATPMESPDGGRTWTIEHIQVPEWNFRG